MSRNDAKGEFVTEIAVVLAYDVRENDLSNSEDPYTVSVRGRLPGANPAGLRVINRNDGPGVLVH